MPSGKFGDTLGPQHNNFDLHSAQELPDSHAWAAQGDEHDQLLQEGGCGGPGCVPVVDLNDGDATRLVGNACRAWGVFQVLNHGVPQALFDEIESLAGTLFSLPMHHKLRAARQPSGFSGYGVARISSFFSKRMWSEGFTIVGSPLDHARALWPDDYSSFCETTEEYRKSMNTLAARLMRLVLASLGIRDMEAADVEWAAAPESGPLQLNSYPACPDPGRAMGLAPHTDSTVLTVLHQSDTSGLQVRRQVLDRWVAVPPIRGALVVHVGDLLHILSNGMFPSVVHRAVVNRSRHRLSVAYLFGPPKSVRIAPLGELVNAQRPPMYRAITWSEYLEKKATHFDKTLTLMRVCEPHTGTRPVNANDHLVA